MDLPPLLSERPRPLQIAMVAGGALIFGFITGAMLGVSAALWAITNVIAAIGGIGGGFEHPTPGSGARRGAIGGLLFGLAVVLADALVVGHREAKLADPAIAFAIVTTIAGTLLGALGGFLRSRAMRRRAGDAPAAA